MSEPYSALMATAQRPPPVFARGEGDWLFDETGRAFLDVVQGWAVNCLGHAPAVVTGALQGQMHALFHAGPGYYNRPALDLAARLAEQSGFDQVFFANSGAEANEGAIKLARKWGALHRDGAFEIITAENAFHGRTLATMSACGKPGWETLFEPKVPGFTKVPYNDLAAVAAAVLERTVAIMVEPIQGEAGVIPAQSEYLEGLRRLADAHGLLLIFDEVQTGMGRTGALFAHHGYGVVPDILTLGKGLGGGVPISALLTQQRFSCFEPGDQGGTFNGNALMTAAAGAVLKTVAEPEFLAGVRARGEQLQQGLAEFSARHGLGEVRGRGLLWALETGDVSATAIVDAALEHDLLINAPRPHVLRFMPALNVGPEAIDEMFRRMERAVADVGGAAGAN